MNLDFVLALAVSTAIDGAVGARPLRDVDRAAAQLLVWTPKLLGLPCSRPRRSGSRPSAAARVLYVGGARPRLEVQVPFLGHPITLSAVPRAVAARGLHELDGRRLYVSRGLGLERLQAPRLRFNCRPEITLITLE